MQNFQNAQAQRAKQLVRNLSMLGWANIGFRCQLGSQEGNNTQLISAEASLRSADPAADALLCAQMPAIEALVHSRNQGVAQYLLPQLLSGERAGAVSAVLGAVKLQIVTSERGFRLNGLISNVANLNPDGFTLIAAASLEDGGVGWLALRSEEDGVDVLPPSSTTSPSWSREALIGDVHCRNVFSGQTNGWAMLISHHIYMH